MKKLTCLLIILLSLNFLPNSAKSQKQDDLYERMISQKMVECNQIAFDCQSEIANLGNRDWQTTRKIIDFWEKNCGENEPNSRMKILLALLLKDTVGRHIVKNYFNFHSHLFKKRVVAARETMLMSFILITKRITTMCP